MTQLTRNIAKCVRSLFSIWRKTQDAPRSTQLLLVDLPTPQESNSVCRTIQSRLVEMGIPTDEIYFIHDQSDEDKSKVYKAWEAGTVRVLIAGRARSPSRPSEKLVAVHCLHDRPGM